MVRDHPCTKDCPDRNGTCKMTCEKLKAYTEKKLKAEAEREKEYRIHQYEMDMLHKRQKRMKRGKNNF